MEKFEKYCNTILSCEKNCPCVIHATYALLYDLSNEIDSLMEDIQKEPISPQVKYEDQIGIINAAIKSKFNRRLEYIFNKYLYEIRT